MGIVIRESIYTTIVTYVGIAIGTVNALFLYTAFLSPDELGLVRILPEMALVFALIAQAGAPYILARFYPLFETQNKKPQAVVTFAFMIGIGGFAILGLSFLLNQEFFLSPYASRSAQIQTYSWSLVPLAFFMFLFSFSESLLRTQYKITLASFLREVVLKLLNAVFVVAFGLKYISLPWFIAGFIMSYAAAFFVLFWTVRTRTGLLPVKFAGVQKEDRRSMLYYGIGCIFSGLGSAFITKMDLMMLPAFTDLAQTGIYAIAIFFTTVMEVPKKSLNQIALPVFIKADAQSNEAEIAALYKKTALLGFFTTASTLLLIWINLDAIFAIMPKGSFYQSGSSVILILGLAKVVDASGGLGLEMLSFTRHFQFVLKAMMVVGLLAVLGNYLLIPAFGITGAALASLSVYLVFLLIRTWYIHRQYAMWPFSKAMMLSLFPLIAASLASYLLTKVTAGWHPIATMLAQTTGAGSVLLGVAYALRISAEINAVVDKALVMVLRLRKP